MMAGEAAAVAASWTPTEQQVEHWFQLRRAKLASGEPISFRDDLRYTALSEDEIWDVIVGANGAVVAWTTRDGGAAAARVSPIVIDGGIYFPTVEGRGKTYALRRDPRATMVFVSQ